MSLTWTASTVGISDKSSIYGFSISPNPASSMSTINYSLAEFSDVTINIYDISGKLVNVLFDGNQHAGNYSLPLLSNGLLKQGIYFVKIYNGKNQHTERILVLD